MGDRRKRDDQPDCTKLAQAQMFVQEDDSVGFNWIEILCYPYIVCGKAWEFCVRICAGTNACMVCWLIMQWIMCKISAYGAPDPVLFPYYFYIFCQVVLMSLIFACLWFFFGKPVVYPYLLAVYNTLTDSKGPNNGSRRMALRRYCFKKSEIFGTSVESGSASQNIDVYAHTVSAALYLLVYNALK
ncbi:hypothetical protein RR46_12763 [Papilio xuthus]|uniref:Uncharacterized protein n=1 Tax=Papilio xuthus TaxID=66420 RepID=A0A194PUS1_PAPXU|nr:hypothetical protein RR46_12763 [Papilio xuthus]